MAMSVFMQKNLCNPVLLKLGFSATKLQLKICFFGECNCNSAYALYEHNDNMCCMFTININGKLSIYKAEIN